MECIESLAERRSTSSNLAVKVGAGEVEASVAELAGVAEVAVVGVADDDLGQRIEAVVVAAGGATVHPDEVIAHVAGQLSVTSAHGRCTSSRVCHATLSESSKAQLRLTRGDVMTTPKPATVHTQKANAPAILEWMIAISTELGKVLIAQHPTGVLEARSGLRGIQADTITSTVRNLTRFIPACGAKPN